MPLRHKFTVLAALVGAQLCGPVARAEVPVSSTIRQLPSSNGHTAVLLDLASARINHFREHLFASEEPQLDQNGNEVWENGEPRTVHTRDLLFDAYFGLRVAGQQAWLTDDTVDLQKSGYLPYASGHSGGTGIAAMVQTRGDLELTTLAFAPQQLPHASFVMALKIRNNGAAVASNVSVFSLHNLHLGFGRPGVRQEIGAQGETLSYDGNGGAQLLAERGFAGVVAARAVGPVSHHAGSYANAPSAQNLFQIVDQGGSNDLPDLTGDAPTQDDSISAFQFDIGNLQPGEEKWVAVVFAHHGDPFAQATVAQWLADYIGNKDAQALVNDEINSWNTFQASINLPPSATGSDETLYRQGAVWLQMAQVKEKDSYLRQWLTTDGEPRYTRFGETPNGPAAMLPATIAHRGHGAVLASLPPGEWSVAWIRDGAYAVAAMAGAGMNSQARDALQFYLDADSGRFQNYSELRPYSMPPYQISLVRYYGMGVEETDFNAFGPNLEFDGFGLFLWALQRYEQQTGDTSLTDQYWTTISERIADPLVHLRQGENGLIAPDSSIWETHWNGRERHYTYTNITAARGLCDAARLAERVGDSARADSYRTAAIELRAAIAAHLTDASGGLASNLEELQSGQGYWDAAVIDGVAMQLFDPQATIANGTFAALDAALATPAGAGWARNDDRFDHSGSDDLSPWGSPYDSGEWVIVDMRGAVAASLAGDDQRASRLTNWVRDQALANYLEVAEVFDEGNGTYKFNAPMMGFGAGAFMLAHQIRSAPADPACGAYFDESGGAGGAGAGGASGSSSSGSGGNGPNDEGGCGCTLPGARSLSGASSGWLFALAALALMRGRQRRRGRRPLLPTPATTSVAGAAGD